MPDPILPDFAVDFKNMSHREKMIATGLITGDETAVLFNTATGLKYPMPEVTSRVDKDEEIDFGRFL